MEKPRFFGREVELQTLRAELIERQGAVMLFGPPGAGKTRLAERLLEEARGERDILFIDNVEAPAHEVAQLIEDLQNAAPRCALLLAGRARPSGVRLLEVRGLEEAAARALFLDRARAIDHRFSLQDEPSMNVIIRRLNGMPLALELAARHTAVMPLRQIALGLDERFALLKTETCALQDGLQEAYEALSPASQRTLCVLSAFGGPFAVDDAATLLDLSPRDTYAALQTLLDAALITVSEPASDALMLYESIRAFARSKLTDPKAAALFKKHAERFAALGVRWAYSLHESDPAEAIVGLHRYQSDFFVALSHAPAPHHKAQVSLALDALLLSMGLVRVHDHVLKIGLEAAEATGCTRMIAQVLAARCRAMLLRGRFKEAIELGERASGFALDDGDPELVIHVRCTQSAVLREAGQPKSALSIAEEMLALAEQQPAPELWLRPLFCRGSARADLDLVGAARGDFCDVLALARTHRARRVEALTLANWAILDERTGPLELALERMRAALDGFESIGERYVTAKCSAILSGWLSRAGLLVEAEAHLARARALAERIDDQETALFASLAKAHLEEQRGQQQRARYEVEVALHSAQRMSAAMAARDAHEALQALLAQRLIVARSGDWFDPMRRGEVQLRRRPALRRILEALITRRVTAPGTPLLAEELVEVGWPGERISHRSGTERVYTAIRTLRQLGLREVLIRRDGGYALDPAIPVERV